MNHTTKRLGCTRLAASAHRDGVEAIRFSIAKAAITERPDGTADERTFSEEVTLLVTPAGKLWLRDHERRRVLEALQEVHAPATGDAQTTLAGVVA